MLYVFSLRGCIIVLYILYRCVCQTHFAPQRWITTRQKSICHVTARLPRHLQYSTTKTAFMCTTESHLMNISCQFSIPISSSVQLFCLWPPRETIIFALPLYLKVWCTSCMHLKTFAQPINKVSILNKFKIQNKFIL